MPGVKLFFMQQQRRAHRCARLPGQDAISPARPAASSAWCAPHWQLAKNDLGGERVIGFDMGGTSTDVSHFAGEFERAFETQVAGVRMRAPMMSIHTVAAGGGSILAFDGARLRVPARERRRQPRPGLLPARRAAGGDRRQRDGRQDPAGLVPERCSAACERPLDRDIVVAKFSELAAADRQATGTRRTPEQVAEGFIDIAVGAMANAIKKISVARGYDVTRYTLQCFGGAGGQHACRVADALGMDARVRTRWPACCRPTAWAWPTRA